MTMRYDEAATGTRTPDIQLGNLNIPLDGQARPAPVNLGVIGGCGDPRSAPIPPASAGKRADSDIDRNTIGTLPICEVVQGPGGEKILAAHPNRAAVAPDPGMAAAEASGVYRECLPSLWAADALSFAGGQR